MGAIHRQTRLYRIGHYFRVFFRSLSTPVLGFIVVVGNSVMILCLGAFYYFEKDINPQVQSLFDAIWWALCTVSTVGFGDIYPMTTGGRLAAMILIVVGIALFVSFTAILATVISTLTAHEVAHLERPMTRKEYEKFHEEIKLILTEVHGLQKNFESKTK